MKSIPIQYKVDINPSYEWSKEAKELNISHRELEVFALVAEGYKNKEIAQILKIKHQSVKTHLYNLKKKIGVKSNTQALLVALHLNVIKLRGKYLDVTGEITSDKIIDGLRKIVSGESRMRGINDKEKRNIKVFLKEHGIDPDNW